MKAKLYKVLDQYHLYDGDKAIATTIVGNPMLLPNLSKQNCDSLFGIIDVEKLVDEYLEKHFSTGLDTNYIQNIVSDGIKYGFNKAMALNKDKVFTLNDMIDFAEYCRSDFDGMMKTKDLFNEYQSIQQPTEIDVEIVMECCGIVYSQHCDGTCVHIKPHLDSEGQSILKKI
jgi:hypothetical protein